MPYGGLLSLTTGFSYRKAQGDRKLKGLQAKLISLQESIEEQLKDVNNLRQEMTKIDTEIASGSGTMANLRDNIRLRKLQRDIAVQAAKMASLNLDEASKARQQFEEKYSKAKEEEEKTTHQVCFYILTDIIYLQNH